MQAKVLYISQDLQQLDKQSANISITHIHNCKQNSYIDTNEMVQLYGYIINMNYFKSLKELTSYPFTHNFTHFATRWNNSKTQIIQY